MPGFDGELFGVAAAQYLSWAQTTFVPTIGFVFLYALGLPLKELPLVGKLEEWSPPQWLLPTFSLGGCSATVFLFSVGLFLSSTPPRLDSADVLRQFSVVRIADVSEVGTPYDVKILVHGHEPYQDLRILSNGYVAYNGAYCTHGACPTVQPEFSVDLGDYGPEHLSLLRQTDNDISLIIGNTGLNSCHLDADIIVEGKSTRNKYHLAVYDQEKGNYILKQSSFAQDDESFYFDSTQNNMNRIQVNYGNPIYLTLLHNGSYRICQRIQFRLVSAKHSS